MVADLRPYSVTLHSQENDQFRRVTLHASSQDEAASIVEGMEASHTAFRLDSDSLAAAREIAVHVPRDADIDGRFYRAGKIVRLRSEHPTRRPLTTATGSTRGHVLAVPAGNRETSGLRAAYARHCQEKPYKVGRVGALDERMVLASMFGLQWQKQIDGSAPVVWSSATIKVALTTSSYTPNQDTHDFFNDVTNEITGTGYTSGGATLGSKTSTYDTASDQIRLDAADTSWTTSTLTARYAVIYNDTAGASSADPVMGFVNFEADISTTAGTFQVTWDSTGIFVVDVT